MISFVSVRNAIAVLIAGVMVFLGYSVWGAGDAGTAWELFFLALYSLATLVRRRAGA